MDAGGFDLSGLRNKVTQKLTKQSELSKPSGKKAKKSNKKKSTDDAKEKGTRQKEPKDREKSQSYNKNDLGKKESKSAGSTSGEDEFTILRREALALGASENDLTLIEGLDEQDNSELEFDSTSNVDKKLSSELQGFIKDLGLGDQDVEVIEDDVPELSRESDSEPSESEGESKSKAQKEPGATKHLRFDDDANSTGIETEDPEEAHVEIREASIKQLKKSKNADRVDNLSSVISDKVLVPIRTDWFNSEISASGEPEKLDRFAIERLYERAKSLVEKDNLTYLKEFTENNSQKKFLTQILSDGTLNDKISALTLLVQESPFHNIKALDNLLAFCQKKSRTAALESINALKDLLLNGLLPDRKLLAFKNQPLRKDTPDKELALFYFEDHLKTVYFKFISILEILSHDPIVHVKMNVLSHIFDLLREKPEQEVNLLRLGVNKLGDIDNKVAAKASYQILKLEQAHPSMKKIIINAVTDILFNPKDSYHSRYYSIITLNQTILLRSEDEIANSLIRTYFSSFEKVLHDIEKFEVDDGEEKSSSEKKVKGRKNLRKNSKKGKKGGKSVKKTEKSESELAEERNSRLISGILTGLNRAFPFSTLSKETYMNHLDTLFRITHSSNFNTSVQALSLISYILENQKLDADRYYRTLYESLLDPRLVTSSKQGVYLNLLYKSLKRDSNIPRILAFVKRILQICLHWLNVGAISGMLYLLLQLAKEHSEVRDLTIDLNSRPEGSIDSSENDSELYDSKKRDPKFAHADSSILWEINNFIDHFHPTVSIYASSFVEGIDQQKPDLRLYTLAHFLDRFVYKNPKQNAVTKGSSIMQPLGGATTGSLLVKATNVKSHELPANTEDWLSMQAENVRPEDKFFHQYFTTKKNKINKPKKNESKDEEELDDEEIWKALVSSKPDVEDDDSEDLSDLDMEDFSEDEDEEPTALDASKTSLALEGEPTNWSSGEESVQLEIESDAENSDASITLQMLEDDESLGSEENVEELEETLEPSKKRKNTDKKKSKRQKLSDMPVFASAEDYSQYLDSDDEDYA